MKTGIAMSLAVAMLYPTIWPHEVGHGLVAYLYGCKATLWQTDTSWFLLSSWGGKDIDDHCLTLRGHNAVALTALGGILVNLLFLLLLVPILWVWHKSVKSSWPFIALFFWMLANYAEAFSYLVLNTAWLKSDMEVVVTAWGVSRWIWFSLSLALAIGLLPLLKPIADKAAAMLSTRPELQPIWLSRFALYVALVGIVMAAARIGLA